MKLSELLKTLKCNRNLYISLMDGGKALDTFSAVKYEGAEDMYGDKDVKNAKITSHSTMYITFDNGEDEEDFEDADEEN